MNRHLTILRKSPFFRLLLPTTPKQRLWCHFLGSDIDRYLGIMSEAQAMSPANLTDLDQYLLDAIADPMLLPHWRMREQLFKDHLEQDELTQQVVTMRHGLDGSKPATWPLINQAFPNCKSSELKHLYKNAINMLRRCIDEDPIYRCLKSLDEQTHYGTFGQSEFLQEEPTSMLRRELERAQEENLLLNLALDQIRAILLALRKGTLREQHQSTA
jgi:hypothetical protein